jgi:hypothetical protein
LTFVIFLTAEALSSLFKARKPPQINGGRRCNWDRGRYSPREFARTGACLWALPALCRPMKD